ncbi:MAG: hypothetical protein ACRCY4_03825 [Brevinema sp.]
MKIESVVFCTIMTVFVSCSQASEPNINGSPPPKKKGFWIFSSQKKELPPRDEARNRVRAMRHLNVFDYVTIFEMEETMHQYAEEAFELKTRFREREQMIMQERGSFISELDGLIKEQDAGKDRTDEILRVYKKLYSNTRKMHELGIEHSQDLQKLSQNIYKDYTSHIDKHMVEYDSNPKELVNMLTEKYKDVQAKRKAQAK